MKNSFHSFQIPESVNYWRYCIYYLFVCPDCAPNIFMVDNFKGLNLPTIFNPLPNKRWFVRVCSTSLLKTLWEKEKLLIMSNFSFSYCVFYQFGQLSSIFNKFDIVICKLCKFGRVYNLLVLKGLRTFLVTFSRIFYFWFAKPFGIVSQMLYFQFEKKLWESDWEWCFDWLVNTVPVFFGAKWML